jgi:hypothetical protein
VLQVDGASGRSARLGTATGTISRRKNPHDLQYQVARLFKLFVDPLLNSVSCYAHKSRSRLPGRDAASDLELPFPQIGLDLLETEFDASAVHLRRSSVEWLI